MLDVLNTISQLICIVMDRKNCNVHLKHVTQVVRGMDFMQPDKIQPFIIVNRCILTCLVENVVVHRGFSDKLKPRSTQ